MLRLNISLTILESSEDGSTNPRHPKYHGLKATCQRRLRDFEVRHQSLATSLSRLVSHAHSLCDKDSLGLIRQFHEQLAEISDQLNKLAEPDLERSHPTALCDLYHGAGADTQSRDAEPTTRTACAVNLRYLGDDMDELFSGSFSEDGFSNLHTAQVSGEPRGLMNRMTSFFGRPGRRHSLGTASTTIFSQDDLDHEDCSE